MNKITPAVHARTRLRSDPKEEIRRSAILRKTHSPDELLKLYQRCAMGLDSASFTMRRILWRALCKDFGHGNTIGAGVLFLHIETFKIGKGVFVGNQAYIQGRFDGKVVIGDHSWIGPQAYLDARDLRIGRYVGWGPGAKALGSTHIGVPLDVPIIQTSLKVERVVIEDEADIGLNAVIMPGVTVGKGAIVGAGSVVTHDVAPYAVVAGVPARLLRWREGYAPKKRLHKVS